jgi:putative nucleotidyltransferase with HDIG domain
MPKKGKPQHEEGSFSSLEIEYEGWRPLTPKDLQKEYKNELLRVASGALNLRHCDTLAHSDRVREDAEKVAKEMHLSSADTDVLLDAALLHDLGKIAFTDELFCLPSLSDEQWSIIKQHPIKGEEILKGLAVIPDEVRDIVRHHHEKLDGTGYPDGLKDDEIKILVRIISIIDAFIAMTHPRKYREKGGKPPSFSRSDAILALEKDASNNKLDTEVVKALRKALFL